MLFTCSKEGIVLVCYGANAESDEVRNLARLVVIIGGMSAPLEPFEATNDDRVIIGKPFVVSSKLFYVAKDRNQGGITNTDMDMLIVHVTGCCMAVLFHNSLPRILDEIENMTSSALHNNTFSDSMAGEFLSIDGILNVLFGTEEVKDDLLVFEEHFLRRIVEDTSTDWFADFASLLLGNESCPSCSIYFFERSADTTQPLTPLFSDYCRNIHDTKSTLKPSLDSYRQELVLSYLADVVVQPERAKEEAGAATRVIVFPDSSAMILCSISESIVLVVTTTQRTNWNDVAETSHAPNDSRIRYLAINALPEALRVAWLACCARVRKALVRTEDLERLPSSLVEKIDHILS